ncbi:hypothetical protein HDU86_003270 [Geranomyces michiganensis]|nr:hypothetical protein HDU86_003270 [Geranomyces michiganensis]
MNPQHHSQVAPPLAGGSGGGGSGGGGNGGPSASSSSSSSSNSNAIITVTFPYTITHHSSTSSAADLLPAIRANVQQLCDRVAAETGCSVSFASPEGRGSAGAASATSAARMRSSREGPAEAMLSVTVMGLTPAVGRARAIMLRSIPTQTRLTIKAPVPLLLSASGEMQPHVRKRLDAIMVATRTEITIVGQNEDIVSSTARKQQLQQNQQQSQAQEQLSSQQQQPQQQAPGADLSPPSFGLGEQGDKKWESMDVEIVGRWEDVEMGKMDVLVFLDELAGLYIEPLVLPPNLHAVLAGRKRCILETVMHDTQTNVYLPTAFLLETCVPDHQPQVAQYARTIWVAGTLPGVRQAIQRLVIMSQQRSSMMQTRTITALPRKLDWLLLNRKDALLSIMSDNATHVTIPALGSAHNGVQVTGDDRVYLERTCRALMHMVCDFYVAGIQLSANPIPPGAQASHPLVVALSQIPLQTHSELLLSPPYIELYGLNPFVKSAFLTLTAHPTLLPMIRDTKFQLELALEHRDFINGKKNGKINKITKTSGCRVTFQEHFNEWNMLIDLYNATPGRCVEGLGMLEDELPAEISFYVPEAYHKRIIGVGGKNIQRIMKKWAVYVKFSNADEFAQLGGYFENMDNVIARTPAKNSINLDHAKANIMELTGIDPKSEVTVTITIPRQLHRLVVGPRAVYLNDIAKNTGVKISFPPKDSGRDDLTVTGSDSGIAVARKRLDELVPAVHFYTVPGGPTAYFAVSSGDITSLGLRLLHELGIEMNVHHPAIDASPNAPASSPESALECTFMLYYHRNHTPPATLEAAKALISEFLVAKGVNIAQSQQARSGAPGMGRSGSYANLQPSNYNDSFQHFHSKLVVGVTSAASENRDTMAFAQFGTAVGSGTATPSNPVGGGISGSKFAQSTPNLRQLFEEGTGGGAGGYAGTMSSPSSPGELKRSKSGMTGDRALLAASLAATSLGQPQWQPRFPGRHPMSIDTTSAEDADNDSGLQDPSKDAELLKGFAGMLSPIDAPPITRDREHHHFGGLKTSRSMSGLEERLVSGRPSSNLVPDASPSDPPATFTQETIRALFGLEQAHPKAFTQTRLLLSSLDLDNYVPIFIEQEVDFPTLLLLGDADLRELGVRAFGTRKRILGAIRECKEWRDRQQMQSQQHAPGGAGSSNSGYQQPLQHPHQQQQPQHHAGGGNTSGFMDQLGGPSFLRRGEYQSHSARASTTTAPSSASFGPPSLIQRSSVGSRPSSQQSTHSGSPGSDKGHQYHHHHHHHHLQPGAQRKGFGEF